MDAKRAFRLSRTNQSVEIRRQYVQIERDIVIAASAGKLFIRHGFEPIEEEVKKMLIEDGYKLSYAEEGMAIQAALYISWRPEPKKRWYARFFRK
jgi:hypothetical protein